MAGAPDTAKYDNIIPPLCAGSMAWPWSSKSTTWRRLPAPSWRRQPLGV